MDVSPDMGDTWGWNFERLPCNYISIIHLHTGQDLCNYTLYNANHIINPPLKDFICELTKYEIRHCGPYFNGLKRNSKVL